jgi:predicted DNA-binding protein with PD1-like motif
VLIFRPPCPVSTKKYNPPPENPQIETAGLCYNDDDRKEEDIMEYRKEQQGGRPVYALRLARGEEIIAALRQFCLATGIRAGAVEGIGAVDYAEIGIYDVAERRYVKQVLEGPMEVTALLGNLSADPQGAPYLHLHITLAQQDLRVVGGHLNAARISGTGELFIRPYDGAIGRRTDEAETGLNLWQLDSPED